MLPGNRESLNGNIKKRYIQTALLKLEVCVTVINTLWLEGGFRSTDVIEMRVRRLRTRCAVSDGRCNTVKDLSGTRH